MPCSGCSALHGVNHNFLKKAQSTEKVKLDLKHLNIKDVEVPKNMTHLPQPLDSTTNRVVKKMEQCEFSESFTNCIAEAF